MKVFLTGVSCVGKTAIGKCVASKLNYLFFDQDVEIEKFFGLPIERLQDKFLTPSSFREYTAKALKYLTEQNENHDYVVALRPSGLMDCYYRILKKLQCTIIVLQDKPENILSRIVFFDKDSNPLVKQMPDDEKAYYLQEIKKDIAYFERTYKKAHLTVDLSGLGIEKSAAKIIDCLNDAAWKKNEPA
jgi:shikimate kinase